MNVKRGFENLVFFGFWPDRFGEIGQLSMEIARLGGAKWFPFQKGSHGEALPEAQNELLAEALLGKTLRKVGFSKCQEFDFGNLGFFGSWPDRLGEIGQFSMEIARQAGTKWFPFQKGSRGGPFRSSK